MCVPAIEKKDLQESCLWILEIGFEFSVFCDHTESIVVKKVYQHYYVQIGALQRMICNEHEGEEERRVSAQKKELFMKPR